jgi:hypothetical protein
LFVHRHAAYGIGCHGAFLSSLLEGETPACTAAEHHANASIEHPAVIVGSVQIVRVGVTLQTGINKFWREADFPKKPGNSTLVVFASKTTQ